MNPDMTPNRMSLDVSITKGKKIKNRYNKHEIELNKHYIG